MASKKKNELKLVNDKPSIRNLLEKSKKAFEAVAPKHLTADRIVKQALIAASRQPKLYKCTANSFLQGVMKAGELGLDCSGTLGRAWLVPFYNSKINAYECQLMPGYQGLIDLARRSGNISRIESRVVYANDMFNVIYGTEQKLEHKPALKKEKGDILCVYGIAVMRDGTRQVEIMTNDEIQSIRKRSKAKDSGPWKTDYAEMARKTVIRRLCKYLPLSPELEKALATDDKQFEDDNTSGIFEMPDADDNTQSRTEQVRKTIKSNEKKPEQPKYECSRCGITDFTEMRDDGLCWSCQGKVKELQPEKS